MGDSLRGTLGALLGARLGVRLRGALNFVEGVAGCLLPPSIQMAQKGENATSDELPLTIGRHANNSSRGHSLDLWE